MFFLLGLTPAQQRGREIYLRGTSPSGRLITATLGKGVDPIPASIVPCVNCHGEDGRGKIEGGVRPADITPAALARAAYTAPLLKRAITMGWSSTRRELNAAMPRYQMSRDDASDLLAFLEMLGKIAPPGVTDDAIRINVIGYESGGEPPHSTIYGRKIVINGGNDAFMTIDASADPTASIDAAARDGIPTIVVQSSKAITERHTFAITATLDDQIAALRTYAKRVGVESVLLTEGCADVPSDKLVLMTSEAAAQCDIRTIPVDRRVIVAAPMPPQSTDAVRAALAITTSLLAQLGRDVTRSDFISALEQVYRVETSTLPPITWTANRRTGTKAAWLMTLDVKAQRLIAEPGWVEGE